MLPGKRSRGQSQGTGIRKIQECRNFTEGTVKSVSVDSDNSLRPGMGAGPGHHLPTRCVLTLNPEALEGTGCRWGGRGVVPLQLCPPWRGSSLTLTALGGHHPLGKQPSQPQFASWADEVVISVSSSANQGHTRPTSFPLKSSVMYYTCLSLEHV